MSVSEVVAKLTAEIDSAIAHPMSIEDALAVLEELTGEIESRIDGLNADLSQ